MAGECFREREDEKKIIRGNLAFEFGKKCIQGQGSYSIQPIMSNGSVMEKVRNLWRFISYNYALDCCTKTKTSCLTYFLIEIDRTKKEKEK